MSPPTVAHVKWMEVFETGIPELDGWHHRLVDRCNSLLELAATQAAWPQVVARTNDLVSDCIAHFHFEEELMERTAFPRLAAHRAAHRELEARLRGLAAQMQAADGTLPAHAALVSSLGLELIELMIRHDLDYRSHILYAQGQ